MSLTSQQYADLAKDAYVNREVGTRPPNRREFDTIDGVKYEILEHYRDRSNGYAGTIYQRVDTGDIVVAHRGTETNLVGIAMDGAYTDGSMVLSRVNPQAQDAIRLTQHALQFAEEKGLRNGGLTPEVTVTGHSLGGCHAEITGHHFNLRGETFNAYGAASLGMRIPEGGDRMINHVMAADFVSAGSPHYGQVRVYASQKEIDSLERFGYENDRSHFDIRMKGVAPLITAGSHGINNFVDHPGGHSILADPDAPSRARHYAPMIDKFREDVREQRGAFSGLADVARGLVGAAPEHRAPLTPGEPALRAGEVRERVVVPPIPTELRDGLQVPVPAPAPLSPSRGMPRSDAPERMAYPPVPDYLRDADRTSSIPGATMPTRATDPRNPEHPDHRLHKQIEAGVARIDASAGRSFDATSERLTMSTLADAKAAGITSADHLVLNTTGKPQQDGSRVAGGTMLFVVQGQDPSDPAARRSITDVAQAVERPLEQSQQKLDVVNQQLAQQQPPPMQENPTLDGPSRGQRV